MARVGGQRVLPEVEPGQAGQAGERGQRVVVHETVTGLDTVELDRSSVETVPYQVQPLEGDELGKSGKRLQPVVGHQEGRGQRVRVERWHRLQPVERQVHCGQAHQAK